MYCCFALLAASAFGQPEVWSGADIGNTGSDGSVELAERDRLTVRGAGADIWGVADSFHFHSRGWEGDFLFETLVYSIEETHHWAKAGIMARASLEPGAAHVFLAMTPRQGPALIRRHEYGTLSEDDAHQAMRIVEKNGRQIFQQRGRGGVESGVGSIVEGEGVRWLRLVRRGDIFSAFDSPDRVNWNWLGTVEVALPGQIQLGFAVCSHAVGETAAAQFGSPEIGRPPGATSSDIVLGDGRGLTARFYNSRLPSGEAVLERVDPIVDFFWENSPADGVAEDGFSVEWNGFIAPQISGIHLLQVVSDDRARLWLSDELLIDEWYEHAAQQSSAFVTLEAGTKYPIRLSLFENSGAAVARLLWANPEMPLQLVPQTQFFPETRDGKETSSVVEEMKTTDREIPKAPTSSETWRFAELGVVGASGGAAYEDSTWTISASGHGFGNVVDSGAFVFREIDNGVDVVTNLRPPNDSDTLAGLMARRNSGPSSPFFGLLFSVEEGVRTYTRSELGGATRIGPVTEALGETTLLRISLENPAYTAYLSNDGGETWRWLDTVAVDLGPDPKVGLAVASRDNSSTTEVEFSDVRVEESLTDSTPSTVVNLPSLGDGLRAKYTDLVTGETVERIDPDVNFNWRRGAPLNGIGANKFTVRWQGYVVPPATGWYRFHVSSDDGAQLWFDERLVVDAWRDRGKEENAWHSFLEAGSAYPIVLDYYENDGQAMVSLDWSTPLSGRSAIPTTNLYSSWEQPSAVPNGENLLIDEGSGSVSPPAILDEPESSSLLNRANLNELFNNKATLTVASAHSGAAVTGTLGEWESVGTTMRAIDRRGALDYMVNLENPGVYLLEIEGGTSNELDSNRSYRFDLSIDEQHIGTQTMRVNGEGRSVIALGTPYLEAGAHKVRVFWDNAKKYRTVDVHRVRMLRVEGDAESGATANGSYLRALLSSRNELFADSNANGDFVARSPVSPARLEGRALFPQHVTVSNADGERLQSQQISRSKWYVEAPLSADGYNGVQVAFENDGLVLLGNIEWTPTYVVATNELEIRTGDSLLLGVHPNFDGDLTFSSGANLHLTAGNTRP